MTHDHCHETHLLVLELCTCLNVGHIMDEGCKNSHARTTPTPLPPSPCLLTSPCPLLHSIGSDLAATAHAAQRLRTRRCDCARGAATAHAALLQPWQSVSPAASAALNSMHAPPAREITISDKNNQFACNTVGLPQYSHFECNTVDLLQYSHFCCNTVDLLQYSHFCCNTYDCRR